ncbi:MAG: RNA-processing protein [Nanohaloarchaea archaeon SW_7_43_1]|nr:MAG: RNA-processing protein [Nanohaloarchaea archaeon SW_7_43_1]
MREVRIPEDRVAVLIGEGGKTKERIEERTELDLEIKDNLVSIDGDPIDEMDGSNIVKAVGRGFNPEKALKIAEKDKMLHIIDISNFASTKNSRDRLKGRVIGRDGETRRHLEKEGNVDISIYGKTIGVIGFAHNIEIVSEVLKQLLNGRSHSSAYGYLEKNQGSIKR